MYYNIHTVQRIIINIHVPTTTLKTAQSHSCLFSPPGVTTILDFTFNVSLLFLMASPTYIYVSKHFVSPCVFATLALSVACEKHPLEYSFGLSRLASPRGPGTGIRHILPLSCGWTFRWFLVVSSPCHGDHSCSSLLMNTEKNLPVIHTWEQNDWAMR